jgi:hypothetical protein
MGTLTSWIEVASSAFLWGGGMLLWTTHKRKAAKINPAVSYADVLFWGLGGIEFGLLTTHGWQAFHRPLIFLVLVVFLGAMITSVLSPAKSSQ